jgi:hypothetical protein
MAEKEQLKLWASRWTLQQAWLQWPQVLIAGNRELQLAMAHVGYSCEGVEAESPIVAWSIERSVWSVDVVLAAGGADRWLSSPGREAADRLHWGIIGLKSSEERAMNAGSRAL